MNPVSGGYQVVEADVPMTGLFGYCTNLRSMTGGRVRMSMNLPAMSRPRLMYRKQRLQRELQKRHKIT